MNMAFRISKEKRKEIDVLIAGVVEAGQALDAAVTSYNDARQALLDTLEAEADEHQSAYDDKSERWQEGDKASAVAEWIEHLRSFDAEIEEIDLSGNLVSADAIQLNDAPEA